MTISKDLLLAILSMDSYNRGYDAGIVESNATGGGLGVSDDTHTYQIGSATVNFDSRIITNEDGDSLDQDAGFYAIAYDVDASGVDGLDEDTTVISYRGTDDFTSLTSANDVVGGWITASSIWQTDQVRMSAEFYQSVTDTTTSDPRTGSAILTGHSLGGGLAGFIGSLYGKEAFVFDNMPFELASDNAQDSADSNTSFGSLVRQYAQDTFYNGGEPWAIDRSNISGRYVYGEALQAARGIGGQNTIVEPLYSIGGLRSPVDLHSMSLLAILQFAADKKHTDWFPAGGSLWDATFSDAVGLAVGFSEAGVGGANGPSGKLMAALAYSALEKNADGSGLVFGNTGIRAMFDDLNELGQVYAQANDATRNAFLNSDLNDGFIIDTTIKQLLADIAVQYAGALAINKVEQIRANLLTGVDANEGVFGLDANKSVLAIDFSDVLWRDVLQTSTSTSTGIAPLHKDSLIDAFHAQTTFWDWLTGTSIADKLDQLAQDYWGGTDRGIFDRYHIATGINGTTIALSERSYARDSGTHVDVYIGDENKINDVTGTSGDDLILTGNTTDFITGGKGKNFINAGEGVDEARYVGDGGSGGVWLNLTKSADYDEALEIDHGAQGSEAITGHDVLTSIERISLSARDDRISFDQAYFAAELPFVTDPGEITYDGGAGFDTADYGDLDGALKFVTNAETGGVTVSFDEGYFGLESTHELEEFERAIMTRKAESLDIGDDILRTLSLHIDMNGFRGGTLEEPAQITKDDWDSVSYYQFEQGITAVNGSVRASGESNDEFGFGLTSQIANYLFGGTPDIGNSNEAADVDALRVTGAEKIVGTVYDDTLWYGDAKSSDWVADGDRVRIGEIKGGSGDDWIVHSGAAYVAEGDAIPESLGGAEGGTSIAAQEMQLTLDGGVGSDKLIATNGTGAILVGGAGRDFLFNSTAYGQLWGDRMDGVGQSTSGVTDSDVFWYWPGTFIMDARQNDILQLFGWPLTGGTNTLTGLPGEDGLAIDWTVWTTFYGYTDSGQLIIYNSLADSLGIGPEGLKGQMIVEEFDFGGFQDNEWGIPKVSDLGMTFRLVLEKDNPNGVNISVWNAIWGHLITQITALTRLAKLVNWKPVDTPFVAAQAFGTKVQARERAFGGCRTRTNRDLLDLDGDGIETVAANDNRLMQLVA